ncbi:MAG: DUF1540 domain-containing protein [Ancrocorticia sp.]|uniref:DUF1540 domain-containing protein n=1 Tax=Ancrocorticia sp. TaxID=2593684 RepID=UPI003F918760
MATQTLVSSCTVTGCSFNNGGCTALAITVGGTAAKPACGTFTDIDARGGIEGTHGTVGACKRLECVHNKDLLCTAGEVAIAGDTADCTTFEAR